MSKRDDAKVDYFNGMKYKDIAEKYGVSINTVKSWRTRHWVNESNTNTQPKQKKGAHKNAKVAEEGAHKSEPENEYGLNPQQEYYCELRAKQYPQYIAYRVAYDRDKKLLESTIAVNASKLEKAPKIKLRIAKLIEKRAKPFHWDNEIAIDKMLDMFYKSMESVLLNGINKSNSDSVYNAFDRLNQLIGFDMLSSLQKKKMQTEVKMLEVKLKSASGSDEEQMDQITKLLDDINGQLD